MHSITFIINIQLFFDFRAMQVEAYTKPEHHNKVKYFLLSYRLHFLHLLILMSVCMCVWKWASKWVWMSISCVYIQRSSSSRFKRAFLWVCDDRTWDAANSSISALDASAFLSCCWNLFVSCRAHADIIQYCVTVQCPNFALYFFIWPASKPAK